MWALRAPGSLRLESRGHVLRPRAQDAWILQDAQCAGGTIFGHPLESRLLSRLRTFSRATFVYRDWDPLRDGSYHFPSPLPHVLYLTPLPNSPWRLPAPLSARPVAPTNCCCKNSRQKFV